MPEYKVKPRNRPIRASTNPAHVPINTDANAVNNPICNDNHAAEISSSSPSNAAYQRVEKCVHTVTSCDSLNEYTTRLTIGMYRNKNPIPSAKICKNLFGFISAFPPAPSPAHTETAPSAPAAAIPSRRSPRMPSASRHCRRTHSTSPGQSSAYSPHPAIPESHTHPPPE